jgi:Bacterial TniB protein
MILLCESMCCARNQRAAHSSTINLVLLAAIVPMEFHNVSHQKDEPAPLSQSLTTQQKPAPNREQIGKAEVHSSNSAADSATRIVGSLSSLLVQHAAFTHAVDRIEACYALSIATKEPVCIALFGESRTGKSSVLDFFCSNHPTERLTDGLAVPVLRVTAPSKPTIKGFCECLLDGIGAPDFSKSGTELSKTRRLQTLLKNTGTKAIVIDEFQHFVDRTTGRVGHHVTDWLKILIDEASCALIVSGLEYGSAVIDQNEQLRGRFLTPLSMPRFLWETPWDQNQFKSILATFHDELSGNFDLPSFHTDDMAFRWWCATGGLIGYAAKILRNLTFDVATSGRKEITLEDLDCAHVLAVRNLDGLAAIRPFTLDFSLTRTSELMRRVSQVGVECKQVDRPRRSRKKAPAVAPELYQA